MIGNMSCCVLVSEGLFPCLAPARPLLLSGCPSLPFLAMPCSTSSVQLLKVFIFSYFSPSLHKPGVLKLCLFGSMTLLDTRTVLVRLRHQENSQIRQQCQQCSTCSSAARNRGHLLLVKDQFCWAKTHQAHCCCLAPS